MKKLATLSLIAVAAFAVTACGPKTDYDGSEVQGVTETKIIVGNTAATTGAFAAVGVPFNVGLQAAFNTYNLSGGFNGKTIELKHYDDEFDGAKGATFTKTLVEDDKVFALVGHFGTNTVGATVDYIKEQGVPMVYAATGINDLYQEGATGYNRAVMPVQPIYKTEGRVLLARALASVEGNYGLGGSKIGVIYTKDDAGLGILEGIKRQAEETNLTIEYAETDATQGTNHSAAVSLIKGKGCDTVIIAANQVPFGEILNYMRDGAYDAKVITSYVSANAVTLGALEDAGSITPNRPVYTTSWLDATTEKGYNDFLMWMAECYLYYGIDLTDPNAATHANYEEATSMALNSYAMAGYCAGNIFVQGLARVKANNEELTWLNYIDAMEEAPLNLPMGGTLSYANGDRLGIAALALNRANKNAATGTGIDAVSPIITLEEVWAQVPASVKK